jgi:hypothetical protein
MPREVNLVVDDLEVENALLVKLGTAARTDTAAVRDGTHHYYTDGTLVYHQVYSELAGGWLDIDAAAIAAVEGEATLDLSGVVTIGDDDVTRGELYLYGAAVDLGGVLRIYNAADQDATNEYWQLYSYQDGLFLGPDGGGDHFFFKNDGDFELLNGGLVVNSSTVIDSSGNVASVNGVASFGPSAVTSITVVDGIVTAIS